MLTLFFIFAFLYKMGIKVVSPFNTKAKLWREGRKEVWKSLEEKCKGNAPIFWFHCASLGEFEQGKPLMQKVKSQNPSVRILVTFFSPSGFEIKKNDPVADIVSYLPMDSPKNSKRFIELVKPICVVFVKYEYWYGYMLQLHLHKIPFYYISAIYRPSQVFFHKHGKWFAHQLQQATHFFVQNKESEMLLNSIDIHNVTIAGDTRFDRVYDIASQNYDFPFMTDFQQNKKLLIAGSTWEPDENVLALLYPHIASDFKLVIAPHVIEISHIQNIKNLFEGKKVICYSDMESVDIQDYEILIIDTIGILSKLYKYSTISYIGGAFHTGLHNTLEAAVYGVPLFFGPEYRKFNEAIELVNAGGAFSIRNMEEMYAHITDLKDDVKYSQVCDICKQFVKNNLGAVDTIYEFLAQNLNLKI